MHFQELPHKFRWLFDKLRYYTRLGVGWFLIVLGVLGVILPVLPGIPFLLLGGWLLGWTRETWVGLLRWCPFDAEIILRRFDRGWQK